MTAAYVWLVCGIAVVALKLLAGLALKWRAVSPDARPARRDLRLTSWRRHAALLLVVGALPACRTGRNYESPTGPRYAGGPRVDRAAGAADVARLRIVSFNIEFGAQVDSAIALLASDPALRAADVILLQEMDGEGTERVADALGLWYVYFPAIYHLRTRREFGNAVLSRWPIVEDRKILLPHTARFSRTRRTATAATLRVGVSLVRVYSTHLSTPTDVAPAGRRDQLRTILSDAARYPRVVIGGDMNDAAVGHVALEMGYAWPTRHGPDTSRLGRWDHIFLKGLVSPDSAAAGTVLEVRRSSDHRPVWAVGMLH
jgi:endonuclease/exonuclease/phosphatase family metal-dependent hydrolase